MRVWCTSLLRDPWTIHNKSCWIELNSSRVALLDPTQPQSAGVGSTSSHWIRPRHISVPSRGDPSRTFTGVDSAGGSVRTKHRLQTRLTERSLLQTSIATNVDDVLRELLVTLSLFLSLPLSEFAICSTIRSAK